MQLLDAQRPAAAMPALKSTPLARYSRGFAIRTARAAECAALGQLIVEAYSQLPGFPRRSEQPAYYELLANVGRFSVKPGVRVLVALTQRNELVGGVVYFGDMAEYATGGTATSLTHTSGVRLLAVDPRFQGMGAGKALMLACIDLARAQGHSEVVLHTTAAMKTAWQLYERLGFVRSEDLDFSQQGLPVFGFRLSL
jgi:GNAT superfamily N-acetyltransferase